MPNHLSTPSLPVAPTTLREGDEMTSFTFGPVTRTDLVRYAGAGGDFNLVHHDDEFARESGLPGVFSMGLFQGGVLAQRLAQWVGPYNVLQFRLRFTGQVWPGDIVEITGQVVAIDGPQATCELLAKTQRGDVVLKADALVRVTDGENGNA